MIILLVGLAFLITSFSSYGIAYQINGINRIIINTPISIFESCLLYDTSADDESVLLSKNLVREKLSNYYSFELSKFTNRYSFEMYFYNQHDDSMCIQDECNAVEINFEASLLYNYQYKRTLKYEVFKTEYGS